MTVTKRPIRRYNLDRTDREFLTTYVLSDYSARVRDAIKAFDTIVAEGGNGLMTADFARMMKADFEQRLGRVDAINDRLTNGFSNGDDDAEVDEEAVD